MGLAEQEFGRVITAMITAFDQDGDLDIDETVRVAKFLQNEGNTAVVVSGTTGEASTLTDAEKLELWTTISETLTIPVIAGSGSNDTPHSINMTKSASQLGVSGILAVAPYYNRPPQSGILGHFEAMARATSLPVIVYDIPVRTGRKIASETLYSLVERNSNVVGLKDAAGDPAVTAQVLAHLKSRIDVYSGDDSLTLPLLAIGAIGVIGVATHWATSLFAQMIESFQKGENQMAIRLNSLLMPSYRFETSEFAPNPIPAKVMMRELGFEVGDCRLPVGTAPIGLDESARVVLKQLRTALHELTTEEVF